MRLLLGLALGFAILAQPAAADPKEKDKPAKSEKPEKPEKPVKADRKAPESEPAAPERRATDEAPAPEVSKKARPSKRIALPAATPTPRTTPSPPPPPDAATAVPVAVPPAATNVPVASPVPAAAPRPRPRPARRRRATRRPPRSAVLGFRATGSHPTAAVTFLPVVSQLPARSMASSSRARSGRRPVEQQAARPSASAATVTRVISVIPAPLRFALFGLAALVALLGMRARRLESQRQDLSDDLGLLQSALLPALPERIGQAWVSAAYRPAEGLAAGGDFYDAFALDEHRTCLLVGDVAGHGRDAIPLTADVRFTLRAYLEAGLGPRAALRATAGVMEPRLGGRFVTVIVAVLDARSGRLTYAAAGHPPPLLLGVEGRLVTSCADPAIGTGLPTGRRQTTVSLPPGATACFITDGLADAKLGTRRLGFTGVADHLRALGGRAGAEALLDRLVRHTDAQPDDMAACLLRPPLGAVATRLGRMEELEVDEDDEGRALRLLLACGVPEREAQDAMTAARDLLPVVLEVHCGRIGATVAVHRPDTAALPLA